MSYKFHYNEKVKIVHGFYAGNKGVIVDVVNQPVTELVSIGRWFSNPVYKVVGIKRMYHVLLAMGGQRTILEQHLEKA